MARRPDGYHRRDSYRNQEGDQAHDLGSSRFRFDEVDFETLLNLDRDCAGDCVFDVPVIYNNRGMCRLCLSAQIGKEMFIKRSTKL